MIDCERGLNDILDRERVLNDIVDRERVLRDVANLAYVAADIREGRFKPHELHQTFDICEGENLERIDHIIDTATEELKHLFGDNLDYRANNNINERFCNNLDCRQPESKLMALYSHEFVVTRVLGDWLSLTLPEAAGVWQEKAHDIYDRLSLSGPNFTVTSRPLPPI